jgi:hypothetical protein
MTGLAVHSISLALVLGHVGVNSLNDVRADWGEEHLWKWNLYCKKISNVD